MSATHRPPPIFVALAAACAAARLSSRTPARAPARSRVATSRHTAHVIFDPLADDISSSSTTKSDSPVSVACVVVVPDAYPTAITFPSGRNVTRVGVSRSGSSALVQSLFQLSLYAVSVRPSAQATTTTSMVGQRASVVAGLAIFASRARANEDMAETRVDDCATCAARRRRRWRAASTCADARMR